MIKYKASVHGRIKAVEVLKETSGFVTRSSGGDRTFREAKTSNGFDPYRYFDTWKDARDWLVGELEREVLSARRSLELANSRLGDVKNMKDP